MARVTLTDTCKVYPGGVKAVDRVSLDIADEEFLVLVGPSGCGKSTTLRMVAGLEEATSGIIKIGDRVVNDVPPKDRDVAMVFQNYALYPHMTVYKNMAFSLKLRRRELGLSKPDIDRKVREAATLLGIEPLLERKPKALSGGQRQRVAVGRAIVRSPRVFLFDEPLSNLDAKMRVEMRSEIKRLQRKLKTTTIYVTHDQEEAMTLGDRIVVMKDGVVQQCASAQEVYERPVNRFVASFVGTPPMSFLDGRVVKQNGGLGFDDGATVIPLPPHLAERLSGQVDRSMVLGIRPDAFSVEPPTAGGTPTPPGGGAGRMPAPQEGAGKRPAPQERNSGVARIGIAKIGVRITLVEPLGDRKDIYMTTAARKNLVGRVDGRVSVFEGQELSMFIDLNRVHLFEPGELGANVTASCEGARSSAN